MTSKALRVSGIFVFGCVEAIIMECSRQGVTVTIWDITA